MALRVWFGEDIANLLQAFAMRDLTDEQRELLDEISMALVGRVFAGVKVVEISAEIETN